MLEAALCGHVLQAAKSGPSSLAPVAPVVLPFDNVNQLIYVTLTDEKLGALTLLVDTGAEHTMIASTIAERGRIKSSFWNPGLSFNAYGNHPAHQKNRKVMLALRSGQTLLFAGTATVADFGRLDKKFEHPMDGVLGWDFFERRCTTLDFAARKLTVRSLSDCAPPKQKYVTLHGEWSSYGLLIRSVLTFPNGQSTPALLNLDTGSDGTLVLPPRFRKVAGINKKGSAGTRASGWGMNGKYCADTVRIAAVDLENGKVRFHDKQGTSILIGRAGCFSNAHWWDGTGEARINRDGGIGNGFLYLATWTFDPAKKKIYVSASTQ